MTFGGLAPDRLLLAINDARNPGDGGQRHFAEGNAAIFFIFGLESAGEILITLVRHDEKLVHRLVEDALAVLIDGQAQAAPDFLALFHGAARFVERANLKDVRVVPAFAKRGVAENEAQRLVLREQPLLLLHNEVVNLVVRLGIPARVLEHCLFLSLAK